VTLMAMGLGHHDQCVL